MGYSFCDTLCVQIGFWGFLISGTMSKKVDFIIYGAEYQ